MKSTNITKEEVAKYALENYPVGAVVRSVAMGNKEEQITSQTMMWLEHCEVWFPGIQHNIKLFDGNRWAEIIKMPEKSYEIY